MKTNKLIFKKIYELKPETTIREISKITGIQCTRVFRIQNGAEMKLSEFNRLNQFINSLNPHAKSIEEFQQTVDESIFKLTPQILDMIATKLRYHLQLQNFRTEEV